MAIEKYKIYETSKLNDKKIGEMMRVIISIFSDITNTLFHDSIEIKYLVLFMFRERNK